LMMTNAWKLGDAAKTYGKGWGDQGTGSPQKSAAQQY